MKQFKGIIWGFVLIVLGVILGLNSIGMTNINLFFDGWWTLFIIVPSFIGLFDDNEKVGNIIGLLIGVALLLGCQNIIDFDLIWKLAFPTILVVIGLSFVFKDMFNKKITEKVKKLNKASNNDDCCATFSGQKINYDGLDFKGTTLTAVFGGIECHLRDAKIKKEAVINATSIFGGIDIYVPKDVKVIVKSTSIFGGVSDKRRGKEVADKNIIYVNATCLFGGVEIK